MDALVGPDVIHFIKKIQRNQKCKNVCDCNVIVLLSVNGGVVQRDGFKLRYLRMRRFEPCFTHFFLSL